LNNQCLHSVLTVLGSINIDLFGRVPKLPAPGETVLGSELIAVPGGKGANQALAAARAGARVRMVGATGTDAYADQAIELLKADGVDLSGIHQLEAATGTAFVLVDPAGENQIAVMSGANLALTPAIVGELLFAPGDVLLLQLEIPVTTMTPTLACAVKAGAVTLLNLAPFNAAGLPLARQVDFVIVNELECSALAEALAIRASSHREMAARVQKALGNTVVLTLGADGALAVTPTGLLTACAPQVNAVDTVGAGDTFCGYLAAGLAAAHGVLNQQILQQATSAASLCCEQRGAQAAIPVAKQIS